MVELRAVGPEFPLYGTLGLESGQTYTHSLLANFGALVRPELLTALDVTRRRLDQLRARTEAQTTAVATLDLPAAPGSADARELVESLGARRDLPALELVENDGRILASRHWPAGIGLEDADDLIDDLAPALRAALKG